MIMTEDGKRLLHLNNKRNIKKLNNLNTNTEELEISKLYLDILEKKEWSNEEISTLQDDREKMFFIIQNRYHCCLSNVPIFRARQYWEILKKQQKLLRICFKDVKSTIKKKNGECTLSTLYDEINYTTCMMSELSLILWDIAGENGEYQYKELKTSDFIPSKTYNDIKNLNDYFEMVNNIFDIFEKVSYYIDDSLKSNDKMKYCSAGNYLFSLVWNYENICALKKEWLISL